MKIQIALAVLPAVFLLAPPAFPALPSVLSSASFVHQGAGDTKPDEKSPDKKPDDKKPDEKKEETKPGKPKPYAEVITKDAVSDPGVFTVHRIDDKIYYEIPPAALNREMLWNTEIAQLPSGAGYGGEAVGSQIVRWTRRNNKVYLRLISYQLRADGKSAVQKAVDAASLEPIIMAFNVEAEGKDKAPVIDVTKLLTSDVPEFSAKEALGGTGIDADRSYVDKVKSFPTNIEVRSMLTYNPKTDNGRSHSSISAMIHYSLTQLPEKPMQGRYFDSRVGYFTEGFEDYAASDNRMMPREYIARYRLEKKDPSAAISEPVKPMVYYISREVPEQWRQFIKQGVEDWNVAFEQAGFKNAILCKVAPTEQEDPNWDPEDARYSVIRWAANPVENAMGPHVHDPRSGEIISAHIIMWHDILKLVENWYFVQCAALDPRARQLPMPEPLIGQLLRYVVAHEVGHTLGLRHNHKASSSYTVAQLRDPAFTEEYGDEASIMDYGRFNYVAQPGDHAHLIPKIGPYDKFAIEWGYTPIPGKTSPEAEKPELDRMAARQVLNPMLRFGGEDWPASMDPTVQTEDLGSDPLAASALGLKNIDRVAAMLIPATTKLGENYDRLGEMYGTLLGQRQDELFHVAKLIGGVVQTNYHAGRGGPVFTPVSKERQEKALDFLLENAFYTPLSLQNPQVLRRIEPMGATNRVLGSQYYLLSSLLSEDRIRRLMDNEAMSPGSVFTTTQLVTELQHGVWAELAQPTPVVNLYRRDLQRAYLRILKPRLVGDNSAQSELRAVGRGALTNLAGSIDRALLRTSDQETLQHLQSCQKEINRILNPVYPTEATPAGPSVALTNSTPTPNF